MSGSQQFTGTEEEWNALVLKNKIYVIAIACHEANRAWCLSEGDTSQKHWEEAEEWQKESAIKGVEFRLNNPEAKQDSQHNAWMQDKINDGWVYGPVKDSEKKTHPCLVPFEQLPLFQQKKDALFCAIVDSLLDKKETTSPGPYGLLHLGRGTFGQAVEAAKKGQKVARKGWNGSGMFAYIVPEASYPAQTGVAKSFFGEGAMVPYREYWALKTAQDDVATWAPSGSDSLANDWCIVE